MSPKDNKNITFIDLFAGIGGMRLAFEAAGCECVLTCEIDQNALITYKKNYQPSHKHLYAHDICKLDSTDIPKHNILIAGFPCQPYSIAGLRKGLKDERGEVFLEIIRILKDKQPDAFLLENVKGIVNHDGGETFRYMQDQLRKAGYEIKHDILNSMTHANVPQNRERIYIIGVLGDVDFSFPTPPKTEVKLGDILEKKVDAKYTISDTLWAGHQRRKAEHIEKGNGFGYSLFNEKSKYTSTISARYYKDGSEILIEQKGKNPRKLTPREAARLQGFPDTFVLPASDTQTYKQFGNSVAVPVVNALAKEVLKTMKKINPKKVEHKKINVEKIKKEKVSAALKALET
jgi:DNA (cytosine-5)-methyltransferase 1